jgi:cell wall-associated NlpC family hydrolase
MTQEQKINVVALAKSLVGKPYAYGADPAAAPHTFDCSSFTQYLFKEVDITIPRSSILQAGAENGIELDVHNQSFIETLEPGDLLFMESDRGFYYDDLFNGRRVLVGHVALYAGNGMVIHARKKTGGVIEQPLAELITEPHYAVTFAKRF